MSTVTVRDPCDQPSSNPRATSSRSPFITGSPCSSSSPGVLLPPSARGLTRDQSSLRVPSHPPRSLSASNLFKIGLLLTAIREDNLHRIDRSWYSGTVPCPLPVASLTCPHIRDTQSLLEVWLTLECRWPAACSEEHCQYPDFLVATCLEISQLLNAAHSSVNK